MAWSLCTKQDVMSIHPTPENALQDFWSDSVEGLIRQHLGNPYLGMTQVVLGELHSGENNTLLMLSKPPVLTVQRVVVNGIPLSSTDYRVISTGIELISHTLPAGNLNVLVDYTSGSAVDEVTGVATIDPVIRLCAAAMIVAILNYRGRAGADASLKWGNASGKEGGITIADQGLTEHLVKIMKRLLRRNNLRVR